MRDLFYNSIGKNTAAITCKNKQGSFVLHFHLSDNPVQHIWQKIHSNSTNLITGIHQGESFESLLEKLNYHCSHVGVTPLANTLTQKDLNALHNQFVINEKNNHWLEINHLIHRIENKIDNPFEKFDSSILFFADNEEFIPIKEEYKVFLNADAKWGNMVLGYGTLGKDWLDLAKDDDIADDLSVQSTISSETRLLFCPEQVVSLFQEQKFYRWAKSTSVNVPLNNLNSLSLGRFMLGQIIITDTLLQFHNIASDWYVPNHKCKLLWNAEVFTEDTILTNIEFIDTDLLFETLKQHTGYKDLNV